MNKPKPNISPWYPLILAAMLVIGCLVSSAGVAWARYRAENSDSFYFQAEVPETVCLGVISHDEAADTERFTTGENNWTRDSGGALRLSFAVSNGSSESDCAGNTQRFRIRVVATMGLDVDWSELMTLRVPTDDEGTGYELYYATITPISKGSRLYSNFGEGWVFRFLDEDGNELSWELEGGQLSYQEMELILTGASPSAATLLQLQAIGEKVQN